MSGACRSTSLKEVVETFHASRLDLLYCTYGTT